MKTCTVCKQDKPLCSYHKSKRSKDGYGYRCKGCDKEARKDYRERNKDRFALVSRKKQLKHKYGISLSDYDRMFKEQQGCCKICGTSENKVTGRKTVLNFAVDHCHQTGRVRGLLCNQCNRALGLFKDDPSLLQKAVKYLMENTK
jgi:hypothetical protein